MPHDTYRHAALVCTPGDHAVYENHKRQHKLLQITSISILIVQTHLLIILVHCTRVRTYVRNDLKWSVAIVSVGEHVIVNTPLLCLQVMILTNFASS